jgi:hypothetical protein
LLIFDYGRLLIAAGGVAERTIRVSWPASNRKQATRESREPRRSQNHESS